MGQWFTIDSKACAQSLEAVTHRLRPAAAQALIGAVRDAEDSASNTTTFQDRHGLDGTRATIKGIPSIDGGGSFEGMLIGRKATRFLEWGTKPHEIRPRNASCLAFHVGGQMVFASKVNHPGTKALRFMREARRVGEQTLEYGVGYFFNKAIHGHGL